MNPVSDRNNITDVESRVRGNTTTAAFCAGALIFFGFFWLELPSGDGLWDKAALAFVLTLRLGGLALALVAGWSCFGHPLALFADAVVSFAIGLLMVLGASLMLMDGGHWLQSFLGIIAGITFLTGGVRTGRDFFAFASAADPEDENDVGQLGRVFDGGLGREALRDVTSSSQPTNEPNAHLVEMQRPEAAPSGRSDRGRELAADEEAIRLPGTGAASAQADGPHSPARAKGDDKRPRGTSPAADGFLANLAENKPK